MQRKKIEDNLVRFQSHRAEANGLRHAAVSLVILENCKGAGKHAILLTLRTSKLRQHSGQYALPGANWMRVKQRSMQRCVRLKRSLDSRFPAAIVLDCWMITQRVRDFALHRSCSGLTREQKSHLHRMKWKRCFKFHLMSWTAKPFPFSNQE